MTEDTVVINDLNKSIQHCVELVKTLDADKKIDANGIVALTLPTDNWIFEDSLFRAFDRNSGSNSAVKKMMSFIDDPLLHDKMKKTKSNPKHFSYPQDMSSGIKFLNDHSPETKFNLVWLDFNRAPTFELFRQCFDIMSNNLQSTALLFVSFNIASSKIDISQMMENFKGDMITHRSFSNFGQEIDNIMDEVLLRESDEMSENLIMFISKIFSLPHQRLNNNLIYTNYDEYSSFITFGFYIGTDLTYARGIQSVSESLMYRHNIDILNENLFPRFLHNINTASDTFHEYSAGHYYRSNIEWNKSFRECPVNSWVFIKIKSKDGNIGKNKHIAIRTSITSKTFKTVSGKSVKAACWYRFSESAWSCKDYNKRHRIIQSMNAQHQAILAREVSDSLTDSLTDL